MLQEANRYEKVDARAEAMRGRVDILKQAAVVAAVATGFNTVDPRLDQPEQIASTVQEPTIAPINIPVPETNDFVNTARHLVDQAMGGEVN